MVEVALGWDFFAVGDFSGSPEISSKKANPGDISDPKVWRSRAFKLCYIAQNSKKLVFLFESCEAPS